MRRVSSTQAGWAAVAALIGACAGLALGARSIGVVLFIAAGVFVLYAWSAWISERRR
jgi:hypothetical protein